MTVGDSPGAVGPGYGGPPSRTPSRRPWIAAGAAIAVAAILTMVYFLGVFGPTPLAPGAGPGPSPNASAMTFSTAYGHANGSARSQPGGPWTLQSAEGLVIPQPRAFSAIFPSNASCPFQTDPTLPATSLADLLQGQFASWFFTFESRPGGALAIAVTTSGTSLISNVPPSSPCGGGGYGVVAPVATIRDSSSFFAGLNAPARAFLQNFTDWYGAVTLSNVPGGLGRASGAAYWEAELTPCAAGPLYNLSAGSPVWYVAMNATSGAMLLDRGGPGIGACPASGTLGVTLGNDVAGGNVGAYTYRFTVNGAPGSLAIDSVRMVVLDHYGETAIGPINATVYEVAGAVAGVYTFATGVWTGGSGPLTAGEAIMITSSVDFYSTGVPETLVLVGSGTPPVVSSGPF